MRNSSTVTQSKVPSVRFHNYVCVFVSGFCRAFFRSEILYINGFKVLALRMIFFV